MPTVPHVLLIGNDVILLRSRKMLLEIFFRVIVSGRFTEAVSFVRNESFDLVVICGDLERWKQIAELAYRSNKQIKVIAVTAKEDEKPAWVDASVCVTHGSYELLKLCAGLFGLASKTRTHGFSLGGSPIYTRKSLRMAALSKTDASKIED